MHDVKNIYCRFARFEYSPHPLSTGNMGSLLRCRASVKGLLRRPFSLSTPAVSSRFHHGSAAASTTPFIDEDPVVFGHVLADRTSRCPSGSPLALPEHLRQFYGTDARSCHVPWVQDRPLTANIGGTIFHVPPNAFSPDSPFMRLLADRASSSTATVQKEEKAPPKTEERAVVVPTVEDHLRSISWVPLFATIRQRHLATVARCGSVRANCDGKGTTYVPAWHFRMKVAIRADVARIDPDGRFLEHVVVPLTVTWDSYDPTPSRVPSPMSRVLDRGVRTDGLVYAVPVRQPDIRAATFRGPARRRREEFAEVMDAAVPLRQGRPLGPASAPTDTFLPFTVGPADAFRRYCATAARQLNERATRAAEAHVARHGVVAGGDASDGRRERLVVTRVECAPALAEAHPLHLPYEVAGGTDWHRIHAVAASHTFHAEQMVPMVAPLATVLSSALMALHAPLSWGAAAVVAPFVGLAIHTVHRCRHLHRWDMDYAGRGRLRSMPTRRDAHVAQYLLTGHSTLPSPHGVDLLERVAPYTRSSSNDTLLCKPV